MTQHKRVFNLSNDIMFSGVMCDKEVCKEFLEETTGIKIRNIINVEPQKHIGTEIKTSNEDKRKARGVRLDLYVEDDAGIKYDVEMQTSNTDNLRKRARYYMGTINSISLIPKANFSTLSKAYVIFVCTFDLFKKNRSRYTFEYTCKEVPELVLHDETTIVYLNTKSDRNDVSDNLKGYLKYLEKSNDETLKKYNSPLARKVANRVNELRKDEKFMNIVLDREEILEEGKEIGIEIGIEEGRKEGREELLKEIITGMIVKGDTNEEIQERINFISLNEIEAIRKQLAESK